MTEKIKILVITPIKHIKNISLNLEKLGTVKYLSDPNQKDFGVKLVSVGPESCKINKNNYLKIHIKPR